MKSSSVIPAINPAELRALAAVGFRLTFSDDVVVTASVDPLRRMRPDIELGISVDVSAVGAVKNGAAEPVYRLRPRPITLKLSVTLLLTGADRSNPPIDRKSTRLNSSHS